MDNDINTDKKQPSPAEIEMKAMTKVLRAVERELPSLGDDSRAWLRARLSTMLVPNNTAS